MALRLLGQISIFGSVSLVFMSLLGTGHLLNFMLLPVFKLMVLQKKFQGWRWVPPTKDIWPHKTVLYRNQWPPLSLPDPASLPHCISWRWSPTITTFLGCTPHSLQMWRRGAGSGLGGVKSRVRNCIKSTQRDISNLLTISINPLAFYNECCSLISYAIHYLFLLTKWRLFLDIFQRVPVKRIYHR